MSDLTCDVVVVGGGMAGISLAAALASDGRVVVVESEPELGRHATGRSAASYLPSYGGAVARALTVASRIGYDEASAERGDPLLTPHPMLLVSTDDESDRALQETAEVTGSLDLVDSAGAIALCDALRPERIRAGGVDSAGMAIEVAGLHQLYLKRLRHAGGRILTSAPLHAVSRRTGGWQVSAGEHSISADVIVDAAGAWVDEVAALAGVPQIGLVPRRRSAFLVPIPVELTANAATWPMVGDAADRWYLKPDGGQLLGSPADQTPCPPCDARPDELEIARAIEEINGCTSLAIRHVSTTWAGLRSFVPDEMPVVGGWADHPGFFFYAGQGGFGIQMAPALAELGAAILTRGESPPRLAALGISAASVSPQRLAPE
ncbi:MAG TPA: FAD-binding oxidoreductase [Mycobacteriales bacterium]|nr:FAD-binding oxidoreductase [Mycobacteriales bacterium]